MPKRWAREGASKGANCCASGSCGATSGAKIAASSQASAIAAPVSASGCRQRRTDAVAAAPAEDAATQGERLAHVTRILGSITP